MKKTKNELTVLDLKLITEKEYIEIIKKLQKQLKKWDTLNDKILRKNELIYKINTTPVIGDIADLIDITSLLSKNETIIENGVVINESPETMVDMYKKTIRLVEIATFFGMHDSPYLNPTSNDYEIVMNYHLYMPLIPSERLSGLYYLIKDYFIDWLGEDYLKRNQLRDDIRKFLSMDKYDTIFLEKLKSEFVEYDLNERQKMNITQEPEVKLKSTDFNSTICEFGYTFSTTMKDIEYGGLDTWEIAIKYRNSDAWIKIFEYQGGSEIIIGSLGNCSPIVERNTKGETIYDNMIVYKKLTNEEINDIQTIIKNSFEATKLFEKYLNSGGRTYKKTKFL